MWGGGPDHLLATPRVGCLLSSFFSGLHLQEDGQYIGRVIDLFSGFGTHDTLQLQLRPTMEDLNACKARFVGWIAD